MEIRWHILAGKRVDWHMPLAQTVIFICVMLILKRVRIFVSLMDIQTFMLTQPVPWRTSREIRPSRELIVIWAMTRILHFRQTVNMLLG